MQALGMIGRGIVAAFKTRLRQHMARLATMATGLGLAIFGVGMVLIGGVLALAQQIGPISAFCGIGGAFVLLGLILAQTARLSAARPQPIQPPNQPLPNAEMPAAAAMIFVLGFVAMRALLRAKDSKQD